MENLDCHELIKQFESKQQGTSTSKDSNSDDEDNAPVMRAPAPKRKRSNSVSVCHFCVIFSFKQSKWLSVHVNYSGHQTTRKTYEEDARRNWLHSWHEEVTSRRSIFSSIQRHRHRWLAAHRYCQTAISTKSDCILRKLHLMGIKFGRIKQSIPLRQSFIFIV